MAKARGICDARCQMFHRERSKKEEILKNQWFIKNRQRLYDNLEGDKITQRVKSLQKRKSSETKVTPEEVKQQILTPWRSGKATNLDWMRPIKPEIKNILYVPKDASFESKEKYLEERYKDKPEDRYYFPYCASWEFGWRLKDYPPSTVSDYGVKSVIQSSFYCKNASSLQRDPDWYRMCQTGDPKNFNELLTY